METGHSQVGMGVAVFPPISSLPVRHRYRPLRPNFGEPRHGQGGWDKVCAHVVQLKFHRDSAQ